MQHRRIAGTIVLALGSAALLVLACSRNDSPSGAAAPERHARYLMPWGGTWKPEDDVPRLPQEKPMMVIWEVSFYPDQKPSEAQSRAAEELRERSFQSAIENDWFTYETGLADGFVPMLGKELDVNTHYANQAFIFDDAILDPSRPEFLMYYPTPSGKKMVGYMFYARTPTEAGPQVGGPLTVWHYHIWAKKVCLLEGLHLIGTADRNGFCDRGTPSHKSPEMIHVWLVDHPKGPFASEMNLDPKLLPDLVARMESRLLLDEQTRAALGKPES